MWCENVLQRSLATNKGPGAVKTFVLYRLSFSVNNSFYITYSEGRRVAGTNTHDPNCTIFLKMEMKSLGEPSEMQVQVKVCFLKP